ncbi:NAD-dependent epimerase/dehydratase [Ilyonectria robusta]
MSVYAASKVEAERALFTYAEEKKPHFAVKSIVLGVNFGKVLDWSIPASSGDFVKELLLGKPERAKQLAYRYDGWIEKIYALGFRELDLLVARLEFHLIAD